MSLGVTTDVFCDFCPKWVEGVTGSRVKARAARTVAKRHGWSRILVSGKFKDLCPNCEGWVLRLPEDRHNKKRRLARER